MHKIFQFLASNVHLSPSGNVYIIPDEWSVYVERREDDRVEYKSGYFLKGTVDVDEGSESSLRDVD